MTGLMLTASCQQTPPQTGRRPPVTSRGARSASTAATARASVATTGRPSATVEALRREPATTTTVGRTATSSTDVSMSTASFVSSTLALRVVGNHIVDAQGRTVRLLGVNRPGMDVLDPAGRCWAMPANLAEIAAIASWDVNAVRIPLNEDCWLGINGVNATTVHAYRAALHAYVAALHTRGIYAILDLHRSAPGATPAAAMQAMPDADHAPAFWSSLAAAFVADHGVVFDLYNEPHLGDVLPEGTNYWHCWLYGCMIPDIYVITAGRQRSLPYPWRAAGMQQLVNSVRSTGATQPIMLSGLNYASGFVGWLTHTPIDPVHQLIASAHIYNESGGCATTACWQQQLAPIARRYPVVTGELGESDCTHGFVDRYMQFADANGISYLGWSWSIETNCHTQTAMALITDWAGTPSSSGIGLRNHLAALAPHR